MRIVNIKRIGNANMLNNSLSKTNSFNNHKPYMFKSKSNGLSIDGKYLNENYKNQILNTVYRMKKKKIKLSKPTKNKIYDPLALEKFNHFFNINFKKEYLLCNS